MYVVGDSITVGSRSWLPKAWNVNALSGRPVDCLRPLLKSTKPNTVVMALGTNSTAGWKFSDYQRAVNMFPRTTKVVFVTTYRDPAKLHNSFNVRVQKTYSEWMRTLAGNRNNVCVADWRKYISQHRNYLPDGTHPAGYGKVAWAKLVKSKVTDCR